MDFSDLSKSGPRFYTQWQYTHHTDQIQIRQSLQMCAKGGQL
jgi:hypothetical protein